jgi:hypothetical protein
MEASKPDFKLLAHQYIKALDEKSKVWRIDEDE